MFNYFTKSYHIFIYIYILIFKIALLFLFPNYIYSNIFSRDLSLRLSRNTKYHIDIYESYATTVQNLTNLGLLMEDTHQASKLRK